MTDGGIFYVGRVKYENFGLITFFNEKQHSKFLTISHHLSNFLNCFSCFMLLHGFLLGRPLETNIPEKVNLRSKFNYKMNLFLSNHSKSLGSSTNL